LSALAPSSTIKLQDIVTWLRSFAECVPVLGTSGYTQEPALTFANDCMQKILAQGMDWKWNQAQVPPFITAALQQDYVTQITNLSWLQWIDRVDINNSTNSGNLAPKPLTNMEVVRDLLGTSAQANPAQACFIPNSQAYMGQWTPSTVIACGYGVASQPATPIQQFVDANGNILYINSAILGLNINSPGYTNTPITLPPNSPYGTTGTVAPSAVPNAPPGVTITDNTVTWTVADPNGYAIRVNPLPAQAGLTWLLIPWYQMKAPKITSLQQFIAPLPDEYAYLFRAGMLAMCYDHAGSNKANAQYAKWEEQIMTALKASQREQDNAIFYPSEGIMGGGGAYNPALGIGPANPYSQGWAGY
jgi:hypothetical protein